MVRKILLQQYQTEEQVQKALNRPSIKRKMEKAKQKNMITNQQWSTLYPLLPEDKIQFKDVDLGLYVVLLRKIGELKIPNSGWEVWPKDTDESQVSHVVRLNLLDLEMKERQQLDENEFEKKWQILEKALLGLKYSAHAIENLKTCCVEQEKNLSYYCYHVWNSPELHRTELIIVCCIALLLISLFDWWDHVLDGLEMCWNFLAWYYYAVSKTIFG